MKKILIRIAVALFILIDVIVLLYPTVSDTINSFSQSRVVAHYFGEVAGLKDNDMLESLEAAHEYNRTLLRKKNRFEFTEEEELEYAKQLKANRNVMGILVIDKIDVKLPIFHGSDEDVLQVGLGHIQGTSLPVGGKGTHSFITGHRGLPSSILLTDLDQLAAGDTFVLYVMGKTLTYRVDQIIIAEPWEIEALKIDPDMDYCTLVTCTPYGINSHRLLVRGCRVEDAVNTDWETNVSDARRLDKFLIIFIFMIPVLPVLITYVIIRCGKIRKGGMVGP